MGCPSPYSEPSCRAGTRPKAGPPQAPSLSLPAEAQGSTARCTSVEDEEGSNLNIMVPKQGCQPSMFEIVVNGDPQRVNEGQTLLDLLRQLELDPERVAIELNRKIVKQPQWSGTVLQPGARLEIVQFVGGG